MGIIGTNDILKGRKKGLGIVYEVNYDSGRQVWIVPIKNKAGSRDAVTGASGAAARALAVQSGAEISDADLDATWAINWLTKYGGMASDKAATVLNFDTRQQLYPAPTPTTGTVIAPAPGTGTKVVQPNAWDDFVANFKKFFGMK